jgi:hypothetical protein
MTANDVTFRLARPGDEPAVTVLSALDSSPRPVDPVLLAEVDGSLWAAVSLADRRAVADPFRPSGDVVRLLRTVADRRSKVRFTARSLTGEP